MCNYFICNNRVYVNATPHAINLQVGSGCVVVPASQKQVINASIKEVQVDDLLVKSIFVGNEEGERIINEIYSEFPEQNRVIIIGSLIAAQAYPGRVFGMCAAEGYERRPPAEKLMRSDKFVTF